MRWEAALLQSRALWGAGLPSSLSSRPVPCRPPLLCALPPRPPNRTTTPTQDVAVSSGSACTSASLEPSYVLRALGVEEDMVRAEGGCVCCSP